MNRNNLAIAIAGVTWAYWAPFYVFIFRDLYLSWPAAAAVLKVLFPLALVANLAGVVLGLVFPAEGRLRAIGAVTLNAVPPVAAACFLWWLFFGVRI